MLPGIRVIEFFFITEEENEVLKFAVLCNCNYMIALRCHRAKKSSKKRSQIEVHMTPVELSKVPDNRYFTICK